MNFCNGCKLECKTVQDLRSAEKVWSRERKSYWWYITDRMKKVVYMGENQKDHTERCTGAKLTKI